MIAVYFSSSLPLVTWFCNSPNRSDVNKLLVCGDVIVRVSAPRDVVGSSILRNSLLLDGAFDSERREIEVKVKVKAKAKALIRGVLV
jgi:hypothetical protein